MMIILNNHGWSFIWKVKVSWFFLDCPHLYCNYLLSNAIHNFSFKNMLISFARYVNAEYILNNVNPFLRENKLWCCNVCWKESKNVEIFVQGEHKRKFITRNLSPKFSIIPSQFFPPNNIPSSNLVVREVFETPHNEIKCQSKKMKLYLMTLSWNLTFFICGREKFFRLQMNSAANPMINTEQSWY